MERDIEVKSYWGVNTKNEYIIQDSNTLVVILPGGKYTTFGPLLYYPYNIALELGYDVLAVEYGFQRSDKDVEFNETTYSHLTKETEEAINQCLDSKDYENILFIGKCLGTYIQSCLINKFLDYKQKHIFITPWADCIDEIVKNSSLVIVGTKDPVFREEHIDKVKNIEKVEVKVIDNANHDLEKENYKESLKVLEEVSDYIYEFLNNNKESNIN